MQLIRSNGLPKKLTQFRSLTTSFNAIWNTRSAMLSQLHGYPVPSLILANIRRYLDVNSVNSLKRGIIKLRDCAKYAAEVLDNIPLLKVDKYQLELRDVHDYVTKHAKDFGFRDLSTDDLTFVAYLITSSEVPQTAWALDLHSTPDDNNIVRLLKLYTELCTIPDAPQITYSKEDGVIIESSTGADVATYYVPVTDKLTPITDVLFPNAYRNALTQEFGAGGDQKLRRQRLRSLSQRYKDEEVLYRLADIRLVDHILMLLLDHTVWSTFISPRVRADQGQNVERSNGLKVFAGYLQSLLVYPHLFRYELFKTGYEGLEMWHGSFPTIPADVMSNYEKFVKQYDVLDAAKDAKELYAAYQTTSDPNLHSNIYVQFSELTQMYGIDDIVARLSGLPKPPSKIKLDRLSELKGPDYDHLLLSYPLEKFPILDELQVRLMEHSRFEEVSKAAFGALSAAYPRYFTGSNILEKTKAAKFSVPFTWHQNLPCSPSFDRGVMTKYTLGEFGIRYAAPWATAINEYKLRTVEIYQFGTASALAGKYQGNIGYDLTLAASLRKQINREWRSLYPANIINGTSLTEPESIIPSEIQLKQLLESISNDSYTAIQKALQNRAFLELWVTYLSSFCLVFRKDPGMDSAALVSGLGSPYGLTYQQLAEMQQFDEGKDYVKLPDTNLVIGFLKKVPFPADNIQIGEFNLQKPYYYFQGNGHHEPIEKFTMSEGLLHMAMRPIKAISLAQTFLFDKWYAYDNDSLYFQVDTRATYNIALDGHEIWKAPIKQEEWQGVKSTIQIDFYNIGKYSALSSGGSAVVPAGEESQKLEKLVTEMKQELKSANEDTVVFKDAQSSENIIDEKKLAADISASGRHDGNHNSNPDASKPTKPKKASTSDKSSQPVAKSKEPIDGAIIMVIPKEGETPDEAIKRVAAHHKLKADAFELI